MVKRKCDIFRYLTLQEEFKQCVQLGFRYKNNNFKFNSLCCVAQICKM